MQKACSQCRSAQKRLRGCPLKLRLDPLILPESSLGSGRGWGVRRGMPAIIGLLNVAGFLVVAALAVAIGRRPAGTPIVYGASLVIAAIGVVTAFVALVSDGSVATLALPLGLPLLGAHFRVDALAAFFLLVVNLGGAIASLYGLGYGRHERSPLRILP